jgi:hypothetical protein
MGIKHTAGWPEKHYQEAKLARQLVDLTSDRVHFWFGLDFIPGVRDIDVLIWHEVVGVFVVEVKGVRLGDVKSFGYDDCQLGYHKRPEKTPNHQAYEAYESLRDFLGRRVKLPFIVATSCWPLITRPRWDARFDTTDVVPDFSSRMIFADDTQGNEDLFADRLRFIYANPPIRTGTKYRRFWSNATTLNALCNNLRPEMQPRATASDSEKLLAIEQTVRLYTRKEAPAGASTRICYRGHAGTGKTFRLIAIAFDHARSDHRVLFCCFNKVLATEIRRLLHGFSELRSSSGEVAVFDVFQFAKSVAAEVPSGDLDAWGERLVRRLGSAHRNVTYDTLLIDEAQDMKQWHLELILMMTHPKSTVCAAEGRGQTLYGEPSKALLDFRATAQTRDLRRNFRNTRPVFQFAYAFHQAALSEARIPKAVRRFVRSAADAPQMPLFNRAVGSLPALEVLAEAAPLPGADCGGIATATDQRSQLVRELARRIQGEKLQLLEDQWEMDLLILVPSESSPIRDWTIEALELLEIKYVDYTRSEHRREVARRETVRVCTYHSARGIEGIRVLILGFEEIERVAQLESQTISNLGYIALSRSKHETSILLRERNTSVKSFLRALHGSLSSHDLELERLCRDDAVDGSTNDPGSARSQDGEREARNDLPKDKVGPAVPARKDLVVPREELRCHAAGRKGGAIPPLRRRRGMAAKTRSSGDSLHPPVPKQPVARVASEMTTVAAFLDWLRKQEGAQRAILKAIEERWLRRLDRLSESDREAVCKEIRKRINSPKLRSPRDQVVRRIEAVSPAQYPPLGAVS